MKWIDGHLDLAYLAVTERDIRHPVPGDIDGCVSLPALRDANVDIVCATIFTYPDQSASQAATYAHSSDLDGAEAAAMKQLAVYDQLAAEGELTIVRDREGLDERTPLPKIVLLMEGADPIRTPEEVPRWRQRGVRIIGLTWSAGTRYAGGNSSGGPLTPAGRELIAAIDHAGLVHDASHLSDEAFDALMEHAAGPVVASHSNCRALLEENERHLRDEQIAAIGSRDGLVGLNLFTDFLAVGRRARIEDCIAHVEHVAEVMGHRRGVALGSDLDGGFGASSLPEGLDRPQKLDVLAEALRGRGWSDDEVQGFCAGNWRRFLEEALVRG